MRAIMRPPRSGTRRPRGAAILPPAGNPPRRAGPARCGGGRVERGNQRGQVGRHRRLDVEAAGDDVLGDDEAARVQRQPGAGGRAVGRGGERVVPFGAAVQRIDEQGEAGGAEVDPDLVVSPGERTCLDERGVESGELPAPSHGEPRARLQGARLPGPGRTRLPAAGGMKRHVDRAGLAGRTAAHEREVRLRDAATLEGEAERPVHLGVAGQQDDAGGLAVDPVDDPQPFLALGLEPPVERFVGGPVARGDHGEPGRLVDGEQVGGLEDHGDGHRGGVCVEPHARVHGRVHAHGPPLLPQGRPSARQARDPAHSGPPSTPAADLRSQTLRKSGPAALVPAPPDGFNHDVRGGRARREERAHGEPHDDREARAGGGGLGRT
jgi:hypothetical protein